jgi:WD40 repeat protein/tRNA A-37 threonylcarbamoyl transferase component Bud32
MKLDNLTGRSIGQYELRELMGKGGMGAVYRAYQPRLRREVAVKVLLNVDTDDEQSVERFTREAYVAASLEHRHIIPIYDYGVDNDISYIVMRLLLGGTLSDRMRADRHPSLTELAGLLRQLASALDYAHAREIIHRDLKPGNIMFDDEQTPYLVDFGIAKLVNATNVLTVSGMLTGTPAFMAPEMWTGADVTPAADLYALGVMTYSLVTGGNLPFNAPTPYAMMNKHLYEAPTPPHEYRANLPRRVVDVLNRAMAKKPDQRFTTTTEFAQAFSEAVGHLTSEEDPPTNFFQPLPPKSPSISLRLEDATASGTVEPVVPPPADDQPTTREAPPQPAIPFPAATRSAPSRFVLGGFAITLVLAVAFAVLLTRAPSGAEVFTPTPEIATSAPMVVVAASPTPEGSPTPIPTPRRLAQLSNRANWVTSLAFSPDGNTLVTASTDGRVRSWDVGVTGLLGELNPSGGSLLAVAYNPNGFTFATASATGAINIFLAPSTDMGTTLTGHSGKVLDLAYRPDGMQLASAGEDGLIKLWSLETLEEIHTLTGHDSAVLSVDYSPDGMTLISGGADGTINLWDVESGDLVRSLRGHEGSVWSVTFNPAGDLIGSGSEDMTGRVWDVQTGEQVFVLRGHTAAVYTLAFSPDGTLLATGSADRTMQIWDAASGSKLSLVISHESAVLSLMWHPDSRRIASGGEDGTWRMWTIRGDTDLPTETPAPNA